jgi:uroporphyrinogen-III decarboxylase
VNEHTQRRTDGNEAFSIDPRADWVAKHNAEACAVVEAWRADRPVRVPVLSPDSFIQHGFFVEESGADYARYYSDPDEMARVQLGAARRRRELPVCDMPLGELPQSWPLTVDFWPVPAPGWIGCEVRFRPDSVPAHRPLHLDREACDAMPMPDPRGGGLLPTMRSFREQIEARWAGGKTFMGRPIGPVRHGVDHYGVLAMALDVRGSEILSDMYEDPAFAHRFLLKMAEWCDALEDAWPRQPDGLRGYFRNTDHGIDMLSPETYEEFIVPVVVEINRRRGTGLPTGIHHCGRGAHLFPVIARRFPLQRIDDLTFPLNDVAAVRRAVGEHVWVSVVIEDGIVRSGPVETIVDTVRDLMRSGAMGRGRLALSVGDLMPGIPMRHRLALYEAVKEYGRYS